MAYNGLKLIYLFFNYLNFEGGCKYQIKGCSGLGGFAQVYKAYNDSNPDDVLALKVKIYSMFYYSGNV